MLSGYYTRPDIAYSKLHCATTLNIVLLCLMSDDFTCQGPVVSKAFNLNGG